MMNSLQIAQSYLETLAGADFDNWSKLLADDAVMIFPYSPPGFPRSYEGQSECVSATRGIMSAIESFEFYDVDLRLCKDPGVVFGTAKSRVMTKDGKPYANDYVFIFRVRGEKIWHYQEYFNPLPVIEAFAAPLGS